MTDSPGSSEQVDVDRRAARQELVATLIMLAALLVAHFLARRGTFEAAWYFPHVFAATLALFALLSLRKARTNLFKVRRLVVLVIVGFGALLPQQHIGGVERKMAAYELAVGAALIGQAAAPLSYVVALQADGLHSEIAELEGRVSLLNFWATWCAPCVAEMPVLEQFWTQNRERGIDVIGVTKLYQNDRETEVRAVESFLEQKSISYPVLVADRDSPPHASYRIRSIPASVLVGRDGKVVDFGAGYQGTKRLMRRAQELAGFD